MKQAVAVTLVIGVLACSRSEAPAKRSDETEREACPPGAELVGSHPPAGTEQWCQRQRPNGDIIRDGSYRKWSTDGLLLIEGDYRDGFPSGTWRKRVGPQLVPIETPQTRDAPPYKDASLLPALELAALVDPTSSQIISVKKRSECEQVPSSQLLCSQQASVWCDIMPSPRPPEPCWSDMRSCESATKRQCRELSLFARWEYERAVNVFLPNPGSSILRSPGSTR